jgi:molybdopterin molybdotransferase
MLTVAEVWQRLDTLVAPLPAETIALALAAGRVLRADALAPEDQPAFDRSSIDGYVASLGTPAGATLRVAGTIPVGQAAPAFPAPIINHKSSIINSASALRLFTGSAVPAGAVGLLMWEDVACSPDGTTITLRAAPSATLIRRRASQARAGDLLLPAGTCLNAGSLALLASLGVTSPVVTRRARVAHLVTGGEIVPPESTPAPGQIRDCNSTLIAALVAATGSADLVAHARSADETHASASAAFSRLLAATPAPDLVLVSGGSSGGEHDHTARLFAEHGFTLAVNQVASRPGKPLLVATRDTPHGRQIAFGLPGNPLSHFVCFHLFVARLLARLAGAEPAPVVRMPLAPGAPLRTNPRETWWPATRTPAGFAPLPWADSSDLTALARTHALLRVPSTAAPDTDAEAILVG